MKTFTTRTLAICLALLTAPAMVFGQRWTSGFDAAKSDGDFNVTSSDPRLQNGTFVWDPVRDNYDQDGDNIYHFTTFTVGPGVAIRIKADRMRRPGPMVIIVQGAVHINGIIDLSGESGHAATQTYTNRAASIPGPGGYPGGTGGKVGEPAQRGFGPGSPGAATNGHGCPAGHSVAAILGDTRLGTADRCGMVGGTYGSTLLLPLVGGSGGTGGAESGNWSGSGGGAGGGALRLISGDLIELLYAGGCCNPAILANGGDNGALGSGGFFGGPGSGGMIYLQAPRVSIPATALGGLQALGQQNTAGYTDASSPGRIRVDTDLWNGGFTNPLALVGPLVQVPLPTNQAELKVVSVDGQNVTQNPKGFYTAPDIVIDKTTPVPVVVQTSNVPVGAKVTLYLTFEPGTADTSGEVTLPEPPANSTGPFSSTFNVTFPRGVTRFFVRAVW